MLVLTDGTNLSVVEETTLGAPTPPTTNWLTLEPNSYGNYGPAYKKEPRAPITKHLQRVGRPMLVDEDSAIPFEGDITKNMIDAFASGVYRVVPKHSGGTGQSKFPVSAVTATGYTVPGLGNFAERTLIVARGFRNPLNNGPKMVGPGSTLTETKTAGLVIEASPPANAEIEVVGWRGAPSDLALDADGNMTSVAVNFTQRGLNQYQWVYIGDPNEDLLGFDTVEFQGAARLFEIAANKLTFDRRSWYVDRGELDLDTVTANVDTIIQARDRGAAVFVEFINDAVAAAGTIEDDELTNTVTIHFKSSVTATTVAQVEALIATSTLIEVQTAGTGATSLAAGDVLAPTQLGFVADGADAGTGKTIDIYYTRWWRNVHGQHDDFIPVSYAFEMMYPNLGASGEDKYEYLLGNMIDEWVWNIPLTAKATINASFIGTHTQKPTVTRKTGPASAIEPNANAGVSTATDIQRLRISDADELGVASDLQSLKITIKNNVSPQKQLARLGAGHMNYGSQDVSVETEIIFTDDEPILAVVDNRPCNLDVLVRNDDFGALIDIQAMTFDTTDRKLEKNKSIILTSKTTGYMDNLSGSTGSLSMFGYLPRLPDVTE